MTKLQEFVRRCYTNMTFREYKDSSGEALCNARIGMIKCWIFEEH